MQTDRVMAVPQSAMVNTTEEFDRLCSEALPELLDRAAMQTKRFLRETGRWTDDISHEKLALRWGYELVERFLVSGRAELPCRPFFLLDSLIAKYYSKPAPLCYHKDLFSPLGRFLEGLTSRAVLSRDALTSIFYHFYGLGPTQVARVLGLGATEAQRVYKNFTRWRNGGWRRAMDEIGLSETELQEIEETAHRAPHRINNEVRRLLRIVQSHYRKSEPDHYPCLLRQRRDELFRENYGYDYRVWHLALCLDCLADVWLLREPVITGRTKLDIDLHVRPLQRGGFMAFFLDARGNGKCHGTGRSTPRVSHTSA
jgi:hypothetical protein